MQERLGVWFRWVLRVVGLGLLVVSLVPFWEGLRALDRRDFVSALMAAFIGYLLLLGGVELVRPESAE